MLGIKRIDHVSVVNSDLEGRVKFYRDLFGMEVAERFETTEAGLGFKGVAMSIPGSPTQWEVLEPLGDDSFLHRFLAERGAGMHHATFEVEDIAKAAAALRAYGVEPFGESTSGDWKQLFIHPRDSGGVLIQLYEKVEES
jgi:methylmalonyl-CoA epimerase